MARGAQHPGQPYRTRWACDTGISTHEPGPALDRESTARVLIASLIAHRLSGSLNHLPGQRGGADAAEGDAVTMTAASPSATAAVIGLKLDNIIRGGADD